MGKKRYEILLMKMTENGMEAVDYYDGGHASEKEARKLAISVSKRCPFKAAEETIDLVQLLCTEWSEFYVRGKLVARMGDFGAKMDDYGDEGR